MERNSGEQTLNFDQFTAVIDDLVAAQSSHGMGLGTLLLQHLKGAYDERKACGTSFLFRGGV
jgi:hypothetical protein